VLARFLAGESPDAPIDVSGGAAMRQISTRVDLWDHLRQGGPIVWPILLIAAVALAIVVYKLVFLHRVHGNTGRLMAEVTEVAGRGDWAACEALVDRREGRRWPLVHVIKAGLAARGAGREALESTLQEAILHELPVVQRGIAILAVLGAVAPLLGLLGTVTGMIDTFRVITLFGTGDPKLMSGGISEALVTTELGLAVAIPIMLLHTILSRRVDHIIGDLEENAVQLTNIILGAEHADGR
jgi:biopolymer transport protein ExbB